jgi:hypothetical protein
MQIENLAWRAASRMKSPTSVESDHWNCCPAEDALRKDTFGVAGAREARMRRLTWERGCEGCNNITVGGVRFWAFPFDTICFS